MNKYIDSEKILACLDIDGTDGCDVISGMFDMANDEGELFVTDTFHYSTNGNPCESMNFCVDLSKADRKEETSKFKNFISTIKEISGYAGEDRTILRSILPAPLAVFASLFLLPAEAGYSDEERELILEDLEMFEDGDLVDEERIREMQQYFAVTELEAAKRVGAGPLAHMLVRHCQRLLTCYMLKAPEIILRIEEGHLAFTMMIHYRGKIAAAQ